MSLNIQALREKRDAAAALLQNLVDQEKTPVWTNDHQAKYDTAMAEITQIDGEIKRYNDAMNAIGAGVSDADRERFTLDAGKQEGQDNSALRNYLTGGLMNLTPEQIQAHNRRRSEDIRAAMSTTTQQEGGYTVAPEYYRQLTEAMKATGGIRNVVTTFQTSTGAQMLWPTADATSEEGEIVGQNSPVGAGDTTFGQLSMDVHKYSSKKIALPFELIQDSMFDIEAYIQALLARRIGRITDKHFTIGTGTNQPKGLITAAQIGKAAATGNATTISYEDLVELEHSVDPIYRNGSRVGFMMHDQTLKQIRKLKDDSGRPIFVPGYEQGNPGGSPDRLLGRPIFLNQDMAPMAANAKSIAFGDFSKYMIREVMDLTLFRMADSAFITNGQIGFIAFNRQGGNLIDVGGAVKVYQNSAT
ncbi:phage major capsid protein [Neisseria weixii]|uniref:Phage major capsid protein n=1 Tax=Neisseria weixii TaxID=1853276 RepID=A0A3N4NGC5_9NEIS|nr:phage major capsid protein [Neisseria weixii]RPD90509.1 phage major capsid protein [Neisseria weixii]RPD90549.1 phage major capsid protein [Neisseria weixii]